ncbi:MAG: hypothetical protein ACXW2U_07265, partial [Telluria sp.]
ESGNLIATFSTSFPRKREPDRYLQHVVPGIAGPDFPRKREPMLSMLKSLQCIFRGWSVVDSA